MNRDEKRSRPQGLPPSAPQLGSHRVIYPSEPGGGTWISLNDSGVTLALINWYSVSNRVTTNPISRGDVIPSMNTAEHPQFVDAAFLQLALGRINPFRLMGIFPKSNEVIEWRWNLVELEREDHSWQSQQWISSGFNEPVAQTIRSRTFNQFLNHASAGTPTWLRRLHSSHTPECGPFSTCMHRPDAVTVSYTQIVVTDEKASLSYSAGPPCNGLPSRKALHL